MTHAPARSPDFRTPGRLLRLLSIPLTSLLAASTLPSGTLEAQIEMPPERVTR